MSFEMSQNERSFEAQFAKREKIETEGGVAEVIDITPPNLKSEKPIFFGNAWACTLEVYRPALEELYKQGRRVIAMDTPRRGGGKFASEEHRKAACIRDVIRSKGLSHLSAITHSNGGSNLIQAAYDNPDLFDDIVLVAPSGLIGPDQIAPMGVRYLKQFTSRPASMKRRFPTPAKTESEVPAVAAKEAIQNYWLKNPARALKEIWDISSVQIQEMLKKLHDNGVGVVVMSSVDDPLYPIDRLQKTFKQEHSRGLPHDIQPLMEKKNAGAQLTGEERGEIDERIEQMAKKHIITGFVSMVGGHGALGDDPAHFMAAAESQLIALERKQQKKR